MIDPFLFERHHAGRPSMWDAIMERPPDVGIRDICALWHGALSDNDEPDGRRFGDHLGLPALAGPQQIVDGWRLVQPEVAGRWIKMSLRAPG